ncbi:dnaJ homolog subfamily C member 30, mitochondrial-like [Pecten maximus]|uniref:dnaJ homolog subfamily C member 30, mitochondrial-like n=1 Tax=Pecten maximus TaxID=6579 RepID=UPI001458BE85|nr:dnaJ homolog subfamily C member 30, mitochondrial-like [Pecten maximus]
MYRYLTRHLQGQMCLCAQKTLSKAHQPLILAPVNMVIQQKINRGYSRRGPRKKSKYDKDLYEVLELSQKATGVQIKGAYFRLSKKYHPDINKSEDAAEKFAEVSEAYEILGRPESRRLYDKGLVEEDFRNTGHPDGWKSYRKGFKKYDGPPMRGRTSIFDFDKWTSTHYSEVFAKKNAERKKFDEFHANVGRQEVKQKRDTGETGTELVIVFLVVFPVMYFLLRSDVKFDKFETLGDTETYQTRELAKKREMEQARLSTSQDLETNLATD